MKVLFVTTISNTVNAFLIPHIRLLKEQGHIVDVAFNIVQEPDPELKKLGCTVYSIPFQRSPLSRKNMEAYRMIKHLIKQNGYDLVHTHTPVASFLTRLAARKLKVNLLYTAHGFHFYKGAPWLNWALYYPMEKIAARWTDGLITINEEDYHAAVSLKLRRKNALFKVNGVGVNLDKFSPQTEETKRELRKVHGFDETDFILFYAAELNHNKHQDLLIETVQRLRESAGDIKLLLAGTGGLEKQYRQQVQDLKLESRVLFLGYRDDIPELLRLSDVAVSASRREGLPVNVMEAMASGLPIVATNCRGNRDLVTDSENGYVVEINDIHEFSRAILELYHSATLRLQFGKKSEEYVNLFAVDHVLEELGTIYSQYLDNRQGLDVEEVYK